MPTLRSFSRALLALSVVTGAASLATRDFIDEGGVSEAYDFVIAGGGLAGLVIASRLSEDSNTTVLVLEAGGNGDDVRSSIDVPLNAYFASLLNTPYDWQYKTVNQTRLGNRELPWPRGKGLGGSTAVNGMYNVRPSALEVDAWKDMLGDLEGKEAWGWDGLLAAMKKSETFTPPSAAIQEQGGILYDLASHGSSGPLHYSYPGYILPVVGNWTSTLDWIGIPPSPDANGGSGWGGFIATSSINPTNWTRSYSRSAYIDPLPPRPNLHILVNATVTKLIINDEGTATAVEWAATRDGPRHTVGVRKEAILAGGAVGSPNILMQSGVGPRHFLEAANVPVVRDLPGVGQHLQDHVSTEVVWRTNQDTAASIHAERPNNLPENFLSFINSAIAYANITDLLGDYAPTFYADITANATWAAENLNPSTDPTVAEGFKAIYNVGTEKILMSQAGQVELLFSLTGTAVGGDKSIAIQAALQHPFSQGQLYISTDNAFDYPIIDPNYMSHPADILMLREGLKLARKLGQTDPLRSAMIEEVSPGANVTTDAQWDAWLLGHVGTEYHPSCTCAMLPLSQGGVVDANLKVYGLNNVRVADSSVYPIQFAAHLQAPTYGLAEQAADIIRSQYNGTPHPASTVTSVPRPSSTPTRSNSPTATASNSSDAARGAAATSLTLLAGVAALFSLFI